ncbi:MAG: hypothetical protein H6Q58_1868 [Firmicutes bacterium]|nr:hypothetical protein [Bacillota bacterium]
MQKNPHIESLQKEPVWERLEAQINWYEGKSRKNRKIFKMMKFIQITMAILIPAIVHVDLPITKWIISILGVLIAIFESVQYMNQYEATWISHSVIAERLEREKFLFLSVAGHYQTLDETERLTQLAERVEELISIEQPNWINERN